MVELGTKSPFGQSFDNSVFIIPALIVVLVVGVLVYFN
uniref:YjcZ family sporulation protein n=1 Tax=Heterorhabditis bacteriophora TaxID=37862 RepID=A0A1I7WZE6_HETBA